MTFRARPVVKRTHRPSWEADHRRTLYLNLAFGLVVLLALLLLGGAVGVGYYNDHWAPLAHVNGVTLNKDDLNERARVDNFRYNFTIAALRQEVNRGRIQQTDADTRIQSLQQQQQAMTPATVLDELIDATLTSQLAAEQGIAVTDQQVTDQLQKEATVPELRHGWVIAVQPALSSGATEPTAEQKAQARAKAEAALAELKGGAKFADVAKKSSDDSTAEQGGDLGFLSSASSTYDDAFVKALFGLQLNGLTEIVEGADGQFRIGTVTQIDASTVDATYQKKVTDSGVSLDVYRKTVRLDLLQQKLDEKITSDLVDKPTVQRHVLQITLAASQGTGDEVKVRHILYSPNDDPQNAASVAADDPAWTKAKDAADAAYKDLAAGKTNFQDVAKKESDDASTKDTGGELGWLTRDSVVQEFGDAIFKDGLKAGDILAPVKSSYGWHIIQYIGRRSTPASLIEDLAKQVAAGKDFATLARNNSDDPEASTGGDLGWVARYQLTDQTLEDAIFKAPVGGVSPTVTTSSGYFLFKVVEEQTRKADGDQATTLKNSGYSTWYGLQKAKASITTEPGATS